MKRFIIALIFALLAAIVLSAEDRLRISVNPQVKATHGDVVVQVTVVPNEANRLLVLAWEGNDIAGTDRVQLDGLEARTTYWFRLKDLPPGTYVVVAGLFDNRGKLVARRDVVIPGPSGEPIYRYRQ